MLFFCLKTSSLQQFSWSQPRWHSHTATCTTQALNALCTWAPRCTLSAEASVQSRRLEGAHAPSTSTSPTCTDATLRPRGRRVEAIEGQERRVNTDLGSTSGWDVRGIRSIDYPASSSSSLPQRMQFRRMRGERVGVLSRMASADEAEIHPVSFWCGWWRDRWVEESRLSVGRLNSCEVSSLLWLFVHRLARLTFHVLK